MSVPIVLLVLILLFVGGVAVAWLLWTRSQRKHKSPRASPSPTPNPKCAASTYQWGTNNLYDMIYSGGCMPPGWTDFFNTPSVQATMQTISNGLVALTQNSDPSQNYHIDPAMGDVFNALTAVPLSQVRAVILGQDPAPEPGEATGYAFDVPVDPQSVPTMGRIMMELFRENYCTNVNTGNTLPWTTQGVLLLNAALTLQCEEPGTSCTYDEPGSNITLWQPFTTALISYISANAQPSAFILWGSAAGAYAQYIDATKHKVLTGGHPSPSAEWQDFFCHSYFYDANSFLSGAGRSPINWNLGKCRSTLNPTTMVCSNCSDSDRVTSNDDVDDLYYSEVVKYCDDAKANGAPRCSR